MRDLSLPGRSPVVATGGMAATSHPLSTQTAIQVLLRGGNAMDAAIAACAVQCVVEPGSTGVGGDCFCLYAPQGSVEPIAFNGSGRAPMAAEHSWFREQGIARIPQRSPHAVTTPGAVDAWSQLCRDHGSMKLGELLKPAIFYAENGYPISSRVHSDFAAAAAFLADDPSTADIFLDNGQIPELGGIHKQPKLARSLRAIGEEGRDVFYSGWIAEDIVGYLQSLGGLHSLADFAETQGDYVTPISSEFRGDTVYQCPPAGQGVTALMLLNLMSEAEIDRAGPISVERIHTELEACRLAYRVRNIYVGDPDFSEIPVEALLSRDAAHELYASINRFRATPPPRELELPNHRDTVYITVVDRQRNVCSFINSLFSSFGSGLVAPRSGVLLHNRGTGFSLAEGHPNCIAPRKRPLHTLIPGMIARDGKAVMSYGVMGGHYQAFGHMQFLTRYYDYGYDLQEAMDLPRFMVNPATGAVEMEKAVPAAIRERLIARGHRIETAARPIGGAQAIHIDWRNNVLTGASDPRKDGCAIGY
ncbi:MAG: gamma-glutamyltranspeptidase [Rhizobiaceae bacterium MnEN-MB40S]|nr:MAG: gamma-glutamyltranspeptidase [Rhizobiaceae bacterium MnEN-MB40S]